MTPHNDLPQDARDVLVAMLTGFYEQSDLKDKFTKHQFVSSAIELMEKGLAVIHTDGENFTFVPVLP